MTPLDAERLAKGVSGTLKAIVPKLSELHQLLQEPPRVSILFPFLHSLFRRRQRLLVYGRTFFFFLAVTCDFAFEFDYLNMGVMKVKVQFSCHRDVRN